MKKQASRMPSSLKDCIDRGWVVGVIQFGSSLTKQSPVDIDLAVIVRRGHLGELVSHTQKRDFRGYDISLIREEEVRDPKNFRFGSHGVHLVPVLKAGQTLYGKNPFLGARVSRMEIKHSILLRLYDYMYEVRKAYFGGSLSRVNHRWPKFARLCLLFVDRRLGFPGVLTMSDREVASRWRVHGVRIHKLNILTSYEAVWEKVLAVW